MNEMVKHLRDSWCSAGAFYVYKHLPQNMERASIRIVSFQNGGCY